MDILKDYENIDDITFPLTNTIHNPTEQKVPPPHTELNI